MNATNENGIIVAFVVAIALFLLFGGGMMSGTTMNGGWMGGSGMMGGSGWMGGTGWMGSISWMWVPTLLTLGLGIVLGWVLFGKHGGQDKQD